METIINKCQKPPTKLQYHPGKKEIVNVRFNYRSHELQSIITVISINIISSMNGYSDFHFDCSLKCLGSDKLQWATNQFIKIKHLFKLFITIIIVMNAKLNASLPSLI